MVSHQDLAGPMAKAMTPSSADIARALEVVRSELEAGPVSTQSLRTAVTDVFGARSGGFGFGTPTYEAGALDSTEVDPNHGVIAAQRAKLAADFALAKLVAMGVATPASTQGYATIIVTSGNNMFSTTGQLNVPVPAVELHSDYRLTPGLDQGALPLTTAEPWFTQAGPLLTDRTRRTLTEALNAARRGLYQAAITLLGAVCESAWYIVGEAFRDSNSDLATELDRDATAQIQRLVRDQLATVKSQRATAGELFSFASYLREIRNYGIHAGSDAQESLEQAFAEAQTALIVMQTHRHLVRLLKAAEQAGAQLNGAES